MAKTSREKKNDKNLAKYDVNVLFVKNVVPEDRAGAGNVRWLSIRR